MYYTPTNSCLNCVHSVGASGKEGFILWCSLNKTTASKLCNKWEREIGSD